MKREEGKMKKTGVGLLLALLLSLGFISSAESAKTSVAGCVNTVCHAWSSDGKLTLMFWVNKTRFVINPNRIKQNRISSPAKLTRGQLAEWEPILEELRMAIARKADVRVWYDNSSKWVTDLRIRFQKRCR